MKHEKVDPRDVKRKDGPSPWGSSYYGLLDECSRKFYFRYVLALIPKSDQQQQSVEEQRQQLQQAIDGGAQVPVGMSTDDYSEAISAFASAHKPDPLRLGTLFHLLAEQWFKGSPAPGLEPEDMPDGTTIEEYSEAQRLASAYFNKHGEIKSLRRGGAHRAGTYEVGHDGAIHFEVLAVEHTVALTEPDELHEVGLLLPVSVRYDTIILPPGQSTVESLEHKTTYRRLDPMSKAMDLQIGMHLLVWNLAREMETDVEPGILGLGPSLGLGDQPAPSMSGVLLDQAVKGVKDPNKIIPERELFRRTPYQLGEVANDLRNAQAKLIHLWAASEKAPGGVAGVVAERLWERRRSACFYWNKPCPYLDICNEGREAAQHLYQLKKPTEGIESNALHKKGK